MEKFIFRGKECYYSCEWVSETEFHFDFSPSADVEFIDENGCPYFIHCEYFEDEDFAGNDDVCSPFALERWYEDEVSCAYSCFKDCLTEQECEYIKKFIRELIDTAPRVGIK